MITLVGGVANCPYLDMDKLQWLTEAWVESGVDYLEFEVNWEYGAHKYDCTLWTTILVDGDVVGSFTFWPEWQGNELLERLEQLERGEMYAT